MANYNRITDKEMEDIKVLCETDISTSQIARIMKRAENTIASIRSGKYESYKEKQKAIGKEKTQEKINGINDERTLLRIADGIDYNNDLLNGILKKLNLLCEELGIKSKEEIK